MKTLFLIIFISWSGMELIAQTKLDSLFNVWNDLSQADTTRLKAMNSFAWDGYLSSKPDSAFYFAQLQYNLAEQNNLKKYMASALNTQGVSLWIRGNYSEALDFHGRSLELREELGDKKGIASSLNNMGVIYQDQGDYPKSLDYYLRTLKIMEEIGDKGAIASSLGNIGSIYQIQGDYSRALNFYQKSLKTREAIGHKSGIAGSLDNIGVIYSDLGDIPKALDYYQRSLRIYEDIEDNRGIANALNNIGLIYKNQGDYQKALDYFGKSFKMREEIGEKRGIASSLTNIGITYKAQGDYRRALEYYEESLKISEELMDKGGIARVLNNIGGIYSVQGEYSKALKYYQQSLEIKKEIGDKKAITKSQINIGSVYQKLQEYQKAILECGKALQLAQELGAIAYQKESCKCLYDAYKAIGNGNQALEYHEQMLALDDSLKSEETSKKLQQMEFAKQVYQDSVEAYDREFKAELAHREEVRLEKQTRNWSIAGGVFALLLAGGFYSRWRYVRKSKAIIESERDRSDNLLLNILPEEIAQELKEKGKADARDFDQVSILFTDFVDFTETSEKLSAAALVEEINTCFEAFDHLLEKYQIEKIKTIGDAYMAAGGLPVPTEDSARNAVLAALEMQEFIEKRHNLRCDKGIPAFRMRAGVHTGPVVAGIVGVKKFQYDVWGDTVNTASRIESHGEAGKVNISQATYELLKEDKSTLLSTAPQFIFESRGKIDVKGKGEMEMYFVSTA